jgi:hypothetical protein
MFRLRPVALLALLAFTPPLPAADPALELAAKFDQLLAAPQKAAGVRPAPLADDAEFLRRVFLDVAGRIPSADEARSFLADPAQDKRQQLVARLLKDPRHVEHFTNIWRALLIPEAAANVNVQLQTNAFDAWLRKQIADNVPYDRFARDVLTVPFGGERVRGSRVMMRRAEEPAPGNPSAAAFYLAKEGKPESLAASTARVFLGVRIECAQCHDHPHAQWTRQQFWSYAAFFAGLSRDAEDTTGVREIFDKREMTIPGGNQVVEAEFLDGSIPEWKFNVGSRVTLADWVTARDNPYFARAAVNRLVAHFFGTGLVDPEDDLRPDNPASHPELLDELAGQFAASGFDVQFLIRSITATQAYQRTSAGADTDPRLFARMAIKRLTPEQLFDSLAQATGYREPQPDPAAGDIVSLPSARGPRAEFLSLFAGGVAGRTDVQLSIPQALLLMNGQFVMDATQPRAQPLSPFLQAVAKDKGLQVGHTTLVSVMTNPRYDTAGRIEALFLATLSRNPTTDESTRLMRHVEGGGPAKDSNRALADVFWALLNSAEFIVNH